jgi:hypothetical protein
MSFTGPITEVVSLKFGPVPRTGPYGQHVIAEIRRPGMGGIEQVEFTRQAAMQLSEQVAELLKGGQRD